MTEVAIRPCRPSDDAALWRILEPVFRAGETYAIDPDIPRAEALAYWTRSIWPTNTARAWFDSRSRPSAGR